MLGTDIFSLIVVAFLGLLLAVSMHGGREEQLQVVKGQSVTGLAIGGMLLMGLGLTLIVLGIWLLVNDPGGVVWTRRAGYVHRWALALDAIALGAWAAYPGWLRFVKAGHISRQGR